MPNLSVAEWVLVAYLTVALIYFGATVGPAGHTATDFSALWTYATYQFAYALIWPAAIPLKLLGIIR